MITDSFSLEEPIIKPEMIYRRSEKLLDVCLITFFLENIPGGQEYGRLEGGWNAFSRFWKV